MFNTNTYKNANNQRIPTLIIRNSIVYNKETAWMMKIMNFEKGYFFLPKPKGIKTLQP